MKIMAAFCYVIVDVSSNSKHPESLITIATEVVHGSLPFIILTE